MNYFFHVDKERQEYWKDMANINGYRGRLAEFVSEAIEAKIATLPKQL